MKLKNDFLPQKHTMHVLALESEEVPSTTTQTEDEATTEEPVTSKL